jgi:hypothetical protein
LREAKNFCHKQNETRQNFVKTESLGTRKTLLNTFIKGLDEVCPFFTALSHCKKNRDSQHLSLNILTMAEIMFWRRGQS